MKKHFDGPSMTRRDIVRLGVAGLAFGVTASASSAPELAGDPAFAGLKVGVHSYSLKAFSFEEAVKMTRDLGVKYIGLKPGKKVHTSVDDPPARLAQAKAYIEDRGLTLMACGVVRFDRSDPAGARKSFEYAKAMGIPVIVANPTLTDDVGMLDPLVDEFGIRIAIHNHGPGRVYSTPEDVLNAIEGHHKYIGACADIGHYVRAGVRAADALAAFGDRLYDVHLKDVSKRAADAETVIIGEGVIDFDAVADQLLKMRFGYHVALEYEAERDNPMPSMAKCFENLQTVLAQASG